MNNLFKHIKTVNKHRRAVRKWCFKMGIPLRGLLHDLSKYSIKELSQCKYYSGNRSPHENMRRQFGYSTSWYHHRNRNKHHWEYWIDSLEDKLAVKMPYKYVIEMLCDMAGAGQTYNKNWKPCDVENYYNLHKGPHRIINIATQTLFEYLLSMLSLADNQRNFFKWYNINKKKIKRLYKEFDGSNLNIFKEMI